MDRCGAGCNFAFDLAYVLHEYGCAGYSVHGERDGGDVEISGQVLTITVTGAADGVSYNLARGQTQGTIQELRAGADGTGKFTATEA